MEEMNNYLQETYYFDYSDDAIQALIKDLKSLPTHEKIGRLFLIVRDQWRTNPLRSTQAKKSTK